MEVRVVGTVVDAFLVHLFGFGKASLQEEEQVEDEMKTGFKTGSGEINVDRSWRVCEAEQSAFISLSFEVRDELQCIGACVCVCFEQGRHGLPAQHREKPDWSKHRQNVAQIEWSPSTRPRLLQICPET